MTLTNLNTRFAIADRLSFREGPGGLIFAEVECEAASATVCLQGAHLTTWQPRGQIEPVIWLSDAAKFAPGKSIRGGVPVCWPWFGAHASDSKLPAHGHARSVMWDATASRALPDGGVELAFKLIDTDATRALWPHPTRCELVLGIGSTLSAELITANQGDTDIVIGEALHTYFRIGDIGEVKVTGLEGSEYLDKTDAFARKRQQGAIGFAGETDRVYVNTASECVIEDARLKRRIRIAKTGAQSTVVWTPWADKARAMGDLSEPDGWRAMLCVESGNAADNVVTVPAGGTHRMAVKYSAESL
jgi:D-hexose-6-phosphate mutarotase